MEAQKIDDEYLGLAHEAGWYSPDELVIPYSVFVEALTLKDEAHRKEMEEALKTVESICDGHTPEHEQIWHFVHGRLNTLTPTKEVTEELKNCPQCGEMKSTVQHYHDNYANMNGDAPNALEYCCYECHVFNTECI